MARETYLNAWAAAWFAGRFAPPERSVVTCDNLVTVPKGNLDPNPVG